MLCKSETLVRRRHHREQVEQSKSTSKSKKKPKFSTSNPPEKPDQPLLPETKIDGFYARSRIVQPLIECVGRVIDVMPAHTFQISQLDTTNSSVSEDIIKHNILKADCKNVDCEAGHHFCSSHMLILSDEIPVGSFPHIVSGSYLFDVCERCVFKRMIRTLFTRNRGHRLLVLFDDAAIKSTNFVSPSKKKLYEKWNAESLKRVLLGKVVRVSGLYHLEDIRNYTETIENLHTQLRHGRLYLKHLNFFFDFFFEFFLNFF